MGAGRTQDGGERSSFSGFWCAFLFLSLVPLRCCVIPTSGAHPAGMFSGALPSQLPEEIPGQSSRLLLPVHGFPVSSIAPPAGSFPEHPSSTPSWPLPLDCGPALVWENSANQQTATTSSLLSLNLNLGENSLSGKFFPWLLTLPQS